MPTITGSEDFDDDIELVPSQSESPLFIEAKKRKAEVIDIDALPASSPPAPAQTNISSSAGKKYVAPASFYAPALPKKVKGPLFVSSLLKLSV